MNINTAELNFSKSVLAALNLTLDVSRAAEGVALGAEMARFEVKFSDGVRAVVRTVNAERGPYAEAVLHDLNGDALPPVGRYFGFEHGDRVSQAGAWRLGLRSKGRRIR
jgi:hypothetical protein